MKLRFFTIVIALSFLVAMPAWGQTNNKSSDVDALMKVSSAKKNARGGQKQNTNSTSLTRSLLEQSTSVVFSCDNGSVPPQYQYRYTITVTKQTVHLLIKKGEGEKTIYDQRADITSSQYLQFVNKLVRQGIKKIKAKVRGDGGSTSSIRVSKNREVLFYGEEDETLSVIHGHLSDAFHQILPSQMKRQINQLQ